MNELSPIEALLQTQREGGFVESTSAFTIDTLKAGRKLASSQLPQAGLWLVKLVQAAVAGRASSAHVVFGNREVEFRCELPEWPGEPKKLISDFLAGALPKQAMLFHLFAGLRASLFEDTVQAEWDITSDGILLTACFNEEGTRLSESPSPNPCSFRLRVSRPRRWPGLKQAVTMPIKHLIRQTAEEYLSLYNYAWPCPLPLTVDGRKLETRYRPSPNIGESRMVELSQQFAVSSPSTPLPSILLAREFVGPSALRFEWAQDRGEHLAIQHNSETLSIKKVLFLGETWIRWPLNESVVPGATLLLLFGNEMDSRVDFICDGAVVDQFPLPWASKTMRVFGRRLKQNSYKLGLRVLFPVSTNDLDLSHFKVREPELLLNDYLPTIRDMLKESTQLCLDYYKEFRFRFAPRPSSAVSELGSLVLGNFVRIHPVFSLLSGVTFNSELKSMLKSIEADENREQNL